ncbi:unnamed protein product [Brassica napus]|uniref:(rape) hypothetical protein n=1 Tax=Brassica napus TaxID=3708 RepID=A0A816SUR4_BRANA|nr:unnamed protein product [Brassica napus]
MLPQLLCFTLLDSDSQPFLPFNLYRCIKKTSSVSIKSFVLRSHKDFSHKAFRRSDDDLLFCHRKNLMEALEARYVKTSERPDSSLSFYFFLKVFDYWTFYQQSHL